MKTAFSVDCDTLETLFKKEELSKLGDFSSGIKNLLSLKLPAKYTFFIVGRDLQNRKNKILVRELAKKGHEIGNHTMNHPQGFRNLSYSKKKEEIKACHDLICEATRTNPVGFRAPSWDIDFETLKILSNLGYSYDSSVFPAGIFVPALKSYNIIANNNIKFSGFGDISFAFSKTSPFEIKIGKNKIKEIPISVSPSIRFPFFGTFLYKFGDIVFDSTYNSIKSKKLPINYNLHLVEFVDYNSINIIKFSHIYKSPSIKIPLKEKLKTFKRAFSKIKKDYRFVCLKELYGKN